MLVQQCCKESSCYGDKIYNEYMIPIEFKPKQSLGMWTLNYLWIGWNKKLGISSNGKIDNQT